MNVSRLLKVDNYGIGQERVSHEEEQENDPFRVGQNIIETERLMPLVATLERRMGVAGRWCNAVFD